MFSDPYLWIGLKRNEQLCGCDCGCACDCAGVTDSECDACRAQWTWSNVSDMRWRNWAPDEPSGVFSCGAATYAHWVARHCADNLRFVCEIGMLRKRQTAICIAAYLHDTYKYNVLYHQ